jgi:hypothetical protein
MSGDQLTMPPVAVKVEQRPAEHTEGRQSTRLDVPASNRQEPRRCRSKMT